MTGWLPEYREHIQSLLEEKLLLATVTRELRYISGMADAMKDHLEVEDPDHEEVDELRYEVAALYTYIAEVLL